MIAMAAVAQPRLCAAIMGVLLWTGSPQWQIEALRRLEIPEDMQRKHEFNPLGGSTDAVKTAIFSGNNARLCNIDVKKTELELRDDRFAALNDTYGSAGDGRSNLRYGYVNRETVGM